MTENNERALSKNNARASSVEYLITEGLHYCCEYFFWARFKHVSSELIAARLGVTLVTIRRHRVWYAEGRYKCKCNAGCILEKRNK
jgi:hypothetical protein